MPKIQVPRGLALFLSLVFQIVVGAMAFSLLYVTAVGIAMMIHGFEEAGHSPVWLAAGGKFAEKAIFGVDCALFALFLCAEIIKYGRAVWEDLRGH